MLKEYIERQPTIQVHDKVGRRAEENGSGIDSRSILHVAGVAVIEQSESDLDEAFDDDDLL